MKLFIGFILFFQSFSANAVINYNIKVQKNHRSMNFMSDADINKKLPYSLPARILVLNKADADKERVKNQIKQLKDSLDDCDIFPLIHSFQYVTVTSKNKISQAEWANQYSNPISSLNLYIRRSFLKKSEFILIYSPTDSKNTKLNTLTGIMVLGNKANDDDEKLLLENFQKDFLENLGLAGELKDFCDRLKIDSRVISNPLPLNLR